MSYLRLQKLTFMVLLVASSSKIDVVWFHCVQLGEVLKTVTSLYLFTREAPLPQPDEVLLCTPHTTSEEVLSLSVGFSFLCFLS